MLQAQGRCWILFPITVSIKGETSVGKHSYAGFFHLFPLLYPGLSTPLALWQSSARDTLLMKQTGHSSFPDYLWTMGNWGLETYWPWATSESQEGKSTAETLASCFPALCWVPRPLERQAPWDTVTDSARPYRPSFRESTCKPVGRRCWWWQERGEGDLERGPTWVPSPLWLRCLC